MAKQKSLFGNLPQLNEATKELNKAIVQKSKSPKKSKTTSVRQTAEKNASTIAKKVALLTETLKSRLVDTGEYECIRTEERFREYMKAVREGKHTFPAIDTETTGLDPLIDTIVGVCLYVVGEKPCYIPMFHTDLLGNILPNQISLEVMREELEKCIDEDVTFVYANATFDMRFVKNSFEMTRYLKIKWDTQTAGSYLNENEPHGLKYLYNKYVSNEEEESETFSSLFKGIPFNFVPIEIGYIYAAKDPLITHQVFKFQELYLDETHSLCISQDLVNAGRFFKETEMPLVEYICEMENEGVKIDKEFASELSVKYNLMLDEVTNRFTEVSKEFDFSKLDIELRSKLSTPVNLNSPVQLAIIFYDAMKLDSVDRKSPRGTGEEVLEKLVAKYPKHKKFFDVILDHRGITKLLTTYIDKIPRLVKEKTGRVHGSLNPYGAKTGRFSAKDPNMQNIPAKNKEIRKMFIADDDYVLIGGDFSQQEPRVLAHLAFVLFDERKLLDAYLAGKDLYAWMASLVYKLPYSHCLETAEDGTKNPAEYKKRRSSVKEIVLGLMYGRKTKSVAELLGISEAEAQKIVDIMFSEFPAIERVVDHFNTMTREKGFVQTVYGRKRRLPDYNLPKYTFLQKADKAKEIEDDAVKAYYTQKMNGAWGKEKRDVVWQDAFSKGVFIIDNSFKIAEAERQILNSVVQGSGGDITKKAMVEIGRSKRLRELGYKLLLTIHDELIGKAPKENALECAKIMQELMLKSTEDTIVVPMSVDVEIFNRWFGEDLTEQLRSA